MSMEMVNKALVNFQAKFPRPGINILVFNWFDLDVDKSSVWPNGKDPGVYVFLDSKKELLC